LQFGHLHQDRYQNIVSPMTTFAVSFLKPTDKSVIILRPRLDAHFDLLDHLLWLPSTLPSLTSAVFDQ
jgi:hypothetical protein